MSYMYPKKLISIQITSCCVYPFRMSTTIMAIWTLLTAARNNPVVFMLNHGLKFLNHEILLLPGPPLPCILPCRINCRKTYLFWFLIMWPRYSIFLFFTVLISVRSLHVHVGRLFMNYWVRYINAITKIGISGKPLLYSPGTLSLGTSLLD